MTLEQQYIESSSVLHRKKYAQFFTPKKIVEFMQDWVFEKKDTGSLLDPAFGLGIFSRNINKEITTTGYEIDKNIINFLNNKQNKTLNLINEDFLESSWEIKYDFILCNPPYLKFHDFDNKKHINSINQHLGSNLSLFTNIYLLFLLKSLSQLKKGGRLAFIIPSEFLNADYGCNVKEYLKNLGIFLHFIIIDYKNNSFNDAITTSCIILCENIPSNSLRISLVNDLKNLSLNSLSFKKFNYIDLNCFIKWKNYYEGLNSEKYNYLVPFSNFATVKRGIATGSNSYFIFNLEKKNKFKIPQENLIPCICKSSDIKDLVFDDKDFEDLKIKNKGIFIFNGERKNDSSTVLEYIKYGENQNIDSKYLTSKRSPWYAVEKRLSAPIWVSVFNRKDIKFIRNFTDSLNLTTFHCVYPTSIFINVDVLFAYLITPTAKEILLDNSRQYGNGLTKLEPNDINNSLMLDLSLLTNSEEDYILSIFYSLIKNKNKKDIYICELDSFFRKKFLK